MYLLNNFFNNEGGINLKNIKLNGNLIAIAAAAAFAVLPAVSHAAYSSTAQSGSQSSNGCKSKVSSIASK
ncbi:MAG: hypothetical protein LW807_02720 [Proteobacteria bacterium]|nr:hypothetical protein [Pseudomonadota bacterium]